MDWIKVKMEDVNRGDLLLAVGGFVVADTLSATFDGEVFWYDTEGGRFGSQGCIEVSTAPVRTQAGGKTPDGLWHALMPEIPGNPPQAACGAKNLDVWESGTALSGVTCPDCRSRYRLVAGGI